jgi:hypothetical protein
MGTVVVELYEALRKAGVEEPLARGAAAAVVPANGLDRLAAKSDICDMATRTDIKDMATKSDIKEILTKSDLKEMATKSDLRIAIAELRGEIAEVKAELIKWYVGTMVAMTALCAAIMRLG